MPHSSLIPKASNFFPVLQPVWNDGVHQVLGWVKSPSRPFSCTQTDSSLNESSWAFLNIASHTRSYVLKVASRPSSGNFSPPILLVQGTQVFAGCLAAPPCPTFQQFFAPFIPAFGKLMILALPTYTVLKPPEHCIFSPLTLTLNPH